jgi:hypothetical protein
MLLTGYASLRQLRASLSRNEQPNETGDTAGPFGMIELSIPNGPVVALQPRPLTRVAAGFGP